MKILVTGGLGFIGSNLVGKLTDRCNILTVIDRRSPDVAINSNPNAANLIYQLSSPQYPHMHLVNEDIENVDPSIFGEQDVIIHLAANPGVQESIKDPTLDLSANLINTFKILNAIKSSPQREHTKFIFASSAAPLAANTTFPLHEAMPLRPLSPYGASKASCECYINAFMASYDINATILRFSNIYGPGSLKKSSVVANMIKTALNTGEIEIFGDGLQTRDFVYIDDLINIIKFSYSTESGSLEWPLHVCSGIPTSILDLSCLIKLSLEEHINKEILIVHQDELKSDARVNFSDASKIKQLGFPTVSPISKQFIDLTVKFFLKNLAY